MPANPTFGSLQLPENGVLESYPSKRQQSSLTPPSEMDWALDVRHYNPGVGNGAESPESIFGNSTSLVSGHTQTYLITFAGGESPDPKVTGFVGWAGYHALADASGPTSASTFGDSTPWMYCYAYRAGECVTGSLAGNMYVSIPFAYTNAACLVNTYAYNSPCISNNYPYGFWVSQFNTTRTDIVGTQSRRISSALVAPGRQYNFTNAKVTPDGKWVQVQAPWLEGQRGDLFWVKLPPFPSEASNPGVATGATNLKLQITGVAGDSIRVAFGYADNGDPANFYCTTRAEACFTSAAATATNPFVFASETQSFIPCSTRCSVSLPSSFRADPVLPIAAAERIEYDDERSRRDRCAVSWLSCRIHGARTWEACGPLDLSVVIPTFNESANVFPLLEKLRKTLAGIEWEVVFVDDNSPDGTSSVIRRIARTDPRVRVIQRIGRRGLSSACIEGMLATSAPYIAVMDADLQHDESILPRMYDRIKTEDLDVVVGSRNTEGGSMGDFAKERVLLSGLGSRLSRAVCNCDLSDPMSGFFIVSRSFLQEVIYRLSGLGFKILVDLVASSKRPVRFAEIPYSFRQREHGESKLDINVGIEYLQLLLDKTIGHIIPSRFMMFGLVGALGLLVHLAMLALLFSVAGYPFLYAQAGATISAMTFNFLLNYLITFRDRRLRGFRLFTGLLTFYAACSIGAVTNFSFAQFLLAAGLKWYIAGVLGMAVTSVWNYGVTAMFTWRRDVLAVQRRTVPEPDAVQGTSR